jgi:F-type H+-transporting ATPase subunit alpha
MDSIAATKDLSDDMIEELKTAIAEFKQMFLAKDQGIRVNEAPAKAMEGVEGREKVTRERPPRPEQ